MNVKTRLEFELTSLHSLHRGTKAKRTIIIKIYIENQNNYHKNIYGKYTGNIR